MVPAPSFFTFAGHTQRIPNSRSVAVRTIRSSPASIRTFERMGIVVFFSTTPWERPNSRTRSFLLTVNSIGQASFTTALVEILTRKNRIHGGCQNVEFYLNYTKFCDFLLKIAVERWRMTQRKSAPRPSLHRSPQPI